MFPWQSLGNNLATLSLESANESVLGGVFMGSRSGLARILVLLGMMLNLIAKKKLQRGQAFACKATPLVRLNSFLTGSFTGQASRYGVMKVRARPRWILFWR